MWQRVVECTTDLRAGQQPSHTTHSIMSLTLSVEHVRPSYLRVTKNGFRRFNNKSDMFCTIYYFLNHPHTHKKVKRLTILLFYVFYTPRVTKLHCITKYNTKIVANQRILIYF